MGRYYNGDIEGKFWFGLQSSDAADRFGYEGTTTHLDYYFDQEELPTVEAEIKSIEESIDVQKIDDFFDTNDRYNDGSLRDANITEAELSQYADLYLGRQIRDSIKRTGECNFTAEL